MEKQGWKITAVIFIILFSCTWIWALYSIYSYSAEEERYYECQYDFCGEYPAAELIDNICYCYDYDLLGEYVLTKTEYMK